MEDLKGGGGTARFTPPRLHTHTPDTDLYRILTLTGKVGGGAVWVGVKLQSAWQVVWRFSLFLRSPVFLHSCTQRDIPEKRNFSFPTLKLQL